MKRILFAGILLWSFLCFIYASANVARSDPDIRGKITIVRRPAAEEEKRIIGKVMVEADQKNAKVDKAYLIVTGKTRILKEQGEERLQATFEDLRVGEIVAARFLEGPTVMIYPLQVEASEIVILNPRDTKEYLLLVSVRGRHFVLETQQVPIGIGEGLGI